MTDTQVRSLMQKYLDGDATDTEMRSLDDWLDESEENRSYFIDYRKRRKSLQGRYRRSVSDIVRLREDDDDEQQYDDLSSGPDESRRLDFRLPVSRSALKSVAIPALVLSVLVGIGYAIYHFWPESRTFTVVSAPSTEFHKTTLSDGSLVILDANARITYSETLSPYARVVYLRGRAFFLIARDDRPFFIRTENALVHTERALVDVHGRADATRLYVSIGEAALIATQHPKRARVSVSAGQLSLCRGPQAPAPASGANAATQLAWLRQTISIDGRPFGRVVAEMQRIYGVRIKLLGGKNLAKRTLTGTYKPREFDALIAAICTQNNLEHHFTGEEYLVRAKRVAKK